jgi:DNA helicase-2/ATP-dependent DNA helicase PcrA
MTRPAPRPDFSAGLNERQREAVLYDDGPLLVVAGPGSGKTRVITFKIARLLSEGVVGPDNILAITFTNKAADEMRRRVASYLSGSRLPLLLRTFHGLALGLLKRHAAELELPRDFAVLDESDRRKLARDCLKSVGLESDRTAADDLLEKASLFKNTLRKLPNIFANDKELQAFLKLEEAKTAAGGLDFDDLLEQAVRLFRDYPEQALRYKTLWTRVLVDEYQDVNPLQYEFLRLVTDRTTRITAVGDDDQCIYEWRGASPEFLFSFEKDFDNVRTVTLDTNYRSTATILSAASGVISANERRKSKDLKVGPDRPQGESVVLVTLPRAGSEGSWILSKMDSLRAAAPSLAWRDFAVFYRTNHQSQALESALLERGIPYRLVGGVRFFEREEIRDIAAYLRVILNPDDETALLRVINTPERGIGATTIGKIRERSYLRDVVADPSHVESPAARKKIAAFKTLVEDLRTEAGTIRDPADLTVRVIEKTGYKDYLDKRPEAERDAKLENLDSFITDLEEKSGRNPDWTLRDFLDDMALFSAADALVEEQDKVSLITLHNAKGLEFPVVFITGFEEGLLPHQSAVRDGSVDEERRLCYVGMTRAKDRLFLLNAIQRIHYGKRLFQQPSRFLRDIPGSCLTLETGGDQIEDSSWSFWQEGDRVLHEEYGEGTVQEADFSGSEPLLRVAFPDRVRQFFPRYTKLKKLS